MTDETPPPTPGTIGGFDPAEYISKFGLPTVILLIVGYVSYNEIIHPIAERYAALLDEVKTNNTELKQGLFTIGETNSTRIQKIEDAILKNSTVIATSIEQTAEKNEVQLETVLRELDTIKDKIDDLRPGRGSAYSAPNFTEPDEST